MDQIEAGDGNFSDDDQFLAVGFDTPGALPSRCCSLKEQVTVSNRQTAIRGYNIADRQH